MFVLRDARPRVSLLHPRGHDCPSAPRSNSACLPSFKPTCAAFVLVMSIFIPRYLSGYLCMCVYNITFGGGGCASPHPSAYIFDFFSYITRARARWDETKYHDARNLQFRPLSREEKKKQTASVKTQTPRSIIAPTYTTPRAYYYSHLSIDTPGMKTVFLII